MLSVLVSISGRKLLEMDVVYRDCLIADAVTPAMFEDGVSEREEMFHVFECRGTMSRVSGANFFLKRQDASKSGEVLKPSHFPQSRSLSIVKM